MLRNREFLIHLIVMGVVSLLSVVSARFISFEAALIVLISSILLITSSLFYTKWRYREIEKLSRYLRQIAAGDDSLDVRDSREGELSILKNEIYKVTRMLSEHRTLLQEDKIQLMDAISDISHQLKTPLTSMTVMADLLSKDNLPPEKRAEFVHHIQVQLERIEWLVSSLLKMAKIDAGTVQFKKDIIPVEMVIQKALEPVMIPMEIKDQSVTVTGDKTATFRGDLNWTVEALINLVKNCVEHTGIGGKLAITYSENTLFTEIVISDNGKGIPKEDLPYIFKRFYKGKNASDESVGIGLAMAHSIITRQMGTIDVKSEVGKGTEFQIKFFKQVI